MSQKHTFLLELLRAPRVLLADALAEEEAPLDGALAWVAEAFLVLDLALLIFSIFSLKYLNYID